MNSGFWSKIKKPILGLAPMDGVTDASFRFMVAKYKKPDVMFTEFVSVEGICSGAEILLDDFKYSDIEKPIVAQVFGVDPEAFYKVAPLLCELGFSGIDINMGCPDKNVAKRGGGAALIKNPELAKNIILKTKQGIKDWSEGKNLEGFGLPEKILKLSKSKFGSKASKFGPERNIIPVSVKTRIGYNEVVIEDWVKYLLELELANISIHGRTLKQMYTGSADWDAIKRAADIIKKTDTLVLGNGDVRSLLDAEEKIEKYSVSGVLVGRATFGNPWFFSGRIPTISERLEAAIEHTEYFEKIFPNKKFYNIKKHLVWYSQGFKNAKELRIELMKAENASDCKKIITVFLKKLKHQTGDF
jgi:tRNA-dihydrouridine synthase